jgi:hypothetical protein
VKGTQWFLFAAINIVPFRTRTKAAGRCSFTRLRRPFSYRTDLWTEQSPILGVIKLYNVGVIKLYNV